MPKTEGKCKKCGQPAKRIEYQGEKKITHLKPTDTRACRALQEVKR